MYFLSEKVKSQNVVRVFILIALALVWLILIKDNITSSIHGKHQYILYLGGTFVASILSGEITRKLIRTFVPLKIKPKNKHHQITNSNKIKEDRSDIEALNFGIAWIIIWIGLALC